MSKQYFAPFPGVVGIQRHVFDEANFDTGFPGKMTKGDQFFFRQAPYRDRIDFDGIEARSLCSLDPGEGLFESLSTSELAELFGRERIQADIDPSQARLKEQFGLVGEQNSVGRQSNIFHAGDCGQLSDQRREFAADQRFTPGEAQFIDSQRNDHANKTFDFLERQQLRFLHKLHVFCRHAVKAAYVAAIGHADPQIVMQSAEGIDEWQFWEHGSSQTGVPDLMVLRSENHSGLKNG